jgi:5-methylcytosine-specific restriction enzyme subunit McrC
MADNIKIKNIYYMLSYAYQTLNEAGFESVSSESFDNVHDLLAAILSRGVSNQIKRGLHRDYLPKTEALGSLRGKIDITVSAKQQTMISNKMVCHYDVFSEDTTLNQILRSAMALLLKHGDVKLENRKALRKNLLYFSNVSDVDPFSINWGAVSYHRNNATYRLLINICWLVIKGMLQTEESGEYRLSTFIDDQQMHRLYEKFVLGYYQKEYPQYSVSAAYIDWNIADDDDMLFLPVMKSDITLANGDKTLIIDTKYYGHTMQYNPMYDSSSIISGNLYQIFTYVKNKDKLGTGNVSGVLLYAKTAEELTPDNDYCIGGNKFGVKTLDLNTDWSEIKSQLDSLPEYYLM